MEIKRLAAEDIPALSRSVAGIMTASPEASHMLSGVTDKLTLATAYYISQITYWFKSGEVWKTCDNLGMLAGHYSGSENSFKLLISTLRSGLQILRNASKADRKMISANTSALSGAQNIKWRKRACSGGKYYYIDLMAIDPALKGSGAFRELISPVIARAGHDGIPVLLDTHDKNNVPLYEHFGFETVRQFAAKNNSDFVQYAMIKRP